MNGPAPLRSLLFVPGTRADRFEKACASGADAIALDLEDGVDPARKDDARRAVGEWLTAVRAARPAPGAACLVRINAPGSSWQEDDLAWLRPLSHLIDGVMLPKAERPQDLERVAAAANARRIVPLLETARAILSAADILAADADVPAVCFGAEDLTAQLGIPRTLDGEELLVARSLVVLAAATVGADPIDAVFVDLAAPDRLRRDAERARGLGFRGKMAIHPNQVSAINEIFTPSAEEIATAQRIVDAEAAARAQGVGAFRLDDRMVDAPIVRRARRVLATAALRRR